tara:strand:- start:9367 stop:11031 length:1665 start_codon:yes stop_codon:yes gene_type:complete
MGWGSGFKTALKSSIITAEYELRFHDNPNQIGSAFSIYSTGGKLKDLKIGREGPTIEGTSVIPQRWNVTFGSFSVPVVGDIRKHSRQLIRGQFAGLYVTINGYTERVCFGQLRNVSGVMGVYTLNFVDIISALSMTANATIDTSITYDRSPFEWFYKTGIQAKLSSAYNAGDTNIAVTELKNFELETGQDGWCLIDGDATTPSGSQSHGQVYATFTAKSAATGAGNLTASTATKTGATIYPGTAANLSSGQFYADTPIRPVAMLQGDPWAIMAKLITSVIGSGGVFDTYPESYTASGHFSDLYDYSNALTMKASVYSISSFGSPTGYPTYTAGYSWMIPVSDSWSNGLRTFVTTASNAGQWPAWRQDKITWRACRRLNDKNIQANKTISEADIISFESFDLYDPNVQNTYQRIKITFQEKANSVTNSTVYHYPFYNNMMPSLPLLPLQEFDNRFLYASSTQTSDDAQRRSMAMGDIYRLLPWANLPLIKIVLKVPLDYAVLCAGDFVDCLIPSQFITSYKPQGDLWRFKAMVTGISYSIQEAFCTLTLHTYEDI